jgi:lipocalin
MMLYYVLYGILLVSQANAIFSTVTSLDLTKYDGRWYQVYGNVYDQLFEHFASCITADYGIMPNGNVSVLNSQYENGKIEQISGYAYPTSQPGQLKVHLDGVLFDAPYWIYDLGEIRQNKYEWSIVSDPKFLSLFVLTRDVEYFYENYDDDVRRILDSYGFTDYMYVNHDNCEYYH